jgi:RNA polymerase sigma-70 factor (ECF subfamily)
MGQRRQRQTEWSDVCDAVLIASSEDEGAAFGIVFDRHVDQIYAYIVRRVGRTLAEELTAETFARAFEQRSRFVAVHESAGPWLYGIATNVVHKAWRAERRQLAAYRKTAAIVAAESDDFGQVEERVDAERDAARLTGALAALAPGHRDALLLFVWEELSYEQIGAALEIPAGTVASRINRARRLLREAPRPSDERSIGVV